MVSLSVALTGFSEDPYWPAVAKEDLRACRQLIEKYHPSFVDTEENHASFQEQLALGYNRALTFAETASTFEDYRDCLAFYIAGFRDGHLNVKTPDAKPVLWPRFLITSRGGKYYIASKFPHQSDEVLPPHEAEVVQINGKDPRVLIEKNLFPYFNDDPALESSWRRLAPLLLFDYRNKKAEPIQSITYLSAEGTATHSLNWSEVDPKEAVGYIGQALYETPLECSIHEFGEKGAWIQLPTFQDSAKAALSQICEQLPQFRDRDPIVFDLRGNTGGSGYWVVRILTAFYGEAYLGSLSHIKNEHSLVDDRLSDEMIDHLEKRISSYANSTDREFCSLLTDYCEKMKAAKAKGEVFLRRTPDVSAFAEMKHGKKVENPVKGKVYLLTDEYCFSSGLIFADAILSIPGVTHIGTMTNGDKRFSQPIWLELPSGKSSLGVPTMIRRYWERGDNEPYQPLYEYEGNMGNREQLEKWVLDLHRTKKLH